MQMDKKVQLLRLLAGLLRVFPVNPRKAVLTAYNGRHYSCSPKYIAEGLLGTGKFDVRFALREDCNEALPAGIRPVRYRSLAHYYHLMTAKYVVFNSSGFAGYLPYRKSQVILNTWHGGYSFKVIGNDFFTDQRSRELRKLSGDTLTYFLSGSRVATEQHSAAMSIAKEKFLNVGLPRNDILFADHGAMRQKVYAHFGLAPEKRLVLYAPTYRDGPVKAMGDYGLPPIDTGAVVAALNARLGGDFVFMYKAHHDMLPGNIGPDCVNASDYADIQELMCAADVLITDYSSCMADFCLVGKPGFLYAPDLKEYGAAHPLSMDPAEWPYPVAGSNAELVAAIQAYTERGNAEKIRRFLDRIGNCDEGHATEALLRDVFK